MIRQQELKPGMRVRLKVRSLDGWKGTATIIDPWEAEALKDGYVADETGDYDYGLISACRHEWAIMHDQTPNPEHAVAVADWVNSDYGRRMIAALGLQEAA